MQIFRSGNYYDITVSGERYITPVDRVGFKIIDSTTLRISYDPVLVSTLSWTGSASDVLDRAGTSYGTTSVAVITKLLPSLTEGSLDAFGRKRTAGTAQRLDVEFTYDKQIDFFDEITNNGTVTFNANTRDLTLSIADAVNGTYAAMSSYPVPYTPGNSQLVEVTGVLDLAGIGGGSAEIFLRSKVTGSVVDTVVAESLWDYDGSIDWSKSHIFVIDFQSLKVGKIRYALNQNGQNIALSSISNDDIRDSGYWQTPSLPAFWRLYNDATSTYMELGLGNEDNAVGIRYKIAANASATMKAICVTVKSEGGININEMPGLPGSIDMGITTKTVSTTLIPLLSIRTKALFNTYDNLSLIVPSSITVQTNNSIRLVVLKDATLTGASWADVDTSKSAAEYDITATALATTGQQIFSDYITTGKNVTGSGSVQLLGKSLLWNRKGSQSGILTIAAVKSDTLDADVLVGSHWKEIR